LDEPRLLRQQLRDLVAVLALPAMWRGQTPEVIVNNLVEVVLSLLRVDFVYVGLTDAAGGPVVEAWRPRDEPGDADLSGIVAQCQELAASASNAERAEPVDLGALRLVRLPLGLLSGEGCLAAGSRRPQFPSARERFLLRAALDQAAVAIQSARSLHQERLARAEAEAAVRTRDEFLSIASHELRNPVAGISGAAQMLQRARARGQLDDARLDRNLAIITQSNARLATLLEDLLDVSRLQSGQLPLRRRPTDLAELVGGAVEQQQLRTTAHRMAVAARTVGRLSIDPDRIEQVVVNLLENAVKYTPGGGEILIELDRDGSGVLVRVRDLGIGLPDGAAERIFEPFGRAANAAVRHLPGLGLGLYICRQIVEQHGGRLWAESPGEDRGTTMTMWLPAAEAPAVRQTGGA
jgi:signal transduction histidine kinase